MEKIIEFNNYEITEEDIKKLETIETYIKSGTEEFSIERDLDTTEKMMIDYCNKFIKQVHIQKRKNSISRFINFAMSEIETENKNDKYSHLFYVICLASVVYIDKTILNMTQTDIKKITHSLTNADVSPTMYMNYLPVLKSREYLSLIDEMIKENHSYTSEHIFESVLEVVDFTGNTKKDLKNVLEVMNDWKNDKNDDDLRDHLFRHDNLTIDEIYDELNKQIDLLETIGLKSEIIDEKRLIISDIPKMKSLSFEDKEKYLKTIKYIDDKDQSLFQKVDSFGFLTSLFKKRIVENLTEFKNNKSK